MNTIEMTDARFIEFLPRKTIKEKQENRKELYWRKLKECKMPEAAVELYIQFKAEGYTIRDWDEYILRR